MNTKIKTVLKKILPDTLVLNAHYCRKLVATWGFQVRDLWLRLGRERKDSLPVGKVSIIIPTLSKGKQADHLPRLCNLLARHLLRQTYQNYEALVYCGGPNPAECSRSLQPCHVENAECRDLGATAKDGGYSVMANHDFVMYCNLDFCTAGGGDSFRAVGFNL